MSFYYHMYGSSIGCLKVFFEGESTKTRTALFTMSGNQGDEWKSASILLKPEENYKVRSSHKQIPICRNAIPPFIFAIF